MEIQHRSITWKDRTYNASASRKEGKNGCRLTVREFNGEKRVLFDGWTPWSSFDAFSSWSDIAWEKP